MPQSVCLLRSRRRTFLLGNVFSLFITKGRGRESTQVLASFSGPRSFPMRTQQPGQGYPRDSTAERIAVGGEPLAFSHKRTYLFFVLLLC